MERPRMLQKNCYIGSAVPQLCMDSQMAISDGVYTPCMQLNKWCMHNKYSLAVMIHLSRYSYNQLGYLSAPQLIRVATQFVFNDAATPLLLDL